MRAHAFMQMRADIQRMQRRRGVFANSPPLAASCRSDRVRSLIILSPPLAFHATPGEAPTIVITPALIIHAQYRISLISRDDLVQVRAHQVRRTSERHESRIVLRIAGSRTIFRLRINEKFVSPSSMLPSLRRRFN